MAESKPQNRPQNGNQDPKTGRFLPGNCANPGGRPKAKLISEAYKQILEDEGAEAYARVVTDVARTAKNKSDRLAAVKEMTDRVEGKALQQHKIEAGIDDNTAKLLADLLGKLDH